jgi:hypothetical protein
LEANLIVPNISWGLGLHECDLLICSKTSYCTEVEIKISKSDLIKDKEKSHGHNSDKIKFLYFAIPDYLNTDEIISHIPERAGILVVRNNGKRLVVSKIREPQRNITAVKITNQERYEIARLGTMRIFGMKLKIKKLQDLLNETRNTPTNSDR